MPAPSPSITAITVAKAGRPSGWASAASRICPTMTPSSAPMTVAAMAASERKSTVSSRIAMPTPMSSPTGASCSEARSIRMPRAATSTPPSSAVSRRREQRLAVGLLEVLRLDVVADVDRGEPPVGRDRAAVGERVGDLDHAVERAHALQRPGHRCPRAGVVDPPLLDAEHERRVRAGERRAVGLEEVERLLGLRARDGEVVGRLAARAGRRAEQHDDDDGAGEAALPAMGEGAREPREQGRHGFSVMGGGTRDTVTRARQTCKDCSLTRLATFCTIRWS